MKKYIIGGIVGAALTVGITAHAEVGSMIGKVVDGVFQVKLDGEVLNTKAIVIEGTSYLPVREFSEKLGYEVTFDMQEGIGLSEAKEGSLPTAPEPDPQETVPEQPDQQVNEPGPADQGQTIPTLDDYNTRISNLELHIESNYLSLQGLGGGTEEQKEAYNKLVEERDRLIAEREKQYPNWND